MKKANELLSTNKELVDKTARPSYFTSESLKLDDSDPYIGQSVINFTDNDLEVMCAASSMLMGIEGDMDILNKQYTIGEIRALWKQKLDDLYAKRDLNIVRKSNINKVIKYVYAWRVSTHFDEYNKEYYIVDNRPALAEHKFYKHDCPEVLKNYDDIFTNEDWLVGLIIRSFVADIYSGLWHVDLRDREVRTICNYLKPLFGTDVIDLIMERRKNKESAAIDIFNSPEDAELIRSLNKQEPDKPSDDLMAMSDQLFGGDET